MLSLIWEGLFETVLSTQACPQSVWEKAEASRNTSSRKEEKNMGEKPVHVAQGKRGGRKQSQRAASSSAAQPHRGTPLTVVHVCDTRYIPGGEFLVEDG